MNTSLYEQFLQAPLTSKDRAFIEKNKEKLLRENAFADLPSFGTGGMREVVELGSNRLNNYNIHRLSIALAQTILKRETKPSLVIGYDSRLTSTTFAQITYHTLVDAGFRVYVFKQPTPTPFISLAVRHFKADGGIVITASHNPSQYNGYKVYGKDGGQIVSPFDKEVQQNFENINYQDLPDKLVAYLSKEISHKDLIEEEITETFLTQLSQEPFLNKQPKKIKVLYSPLHGTGGWIFKTSFQHFGFENFAILSSQEKPDGNFSNTTGLNPEEEKAFTALKEKGQAGDYALLLATDPDADRVGAAVKTDSGYSMLTGNQIGALLLASLAKKKAPTLKAPFACKTIVTSELQRHIAKSMGVRMVETLTGFKFIANAIAQDPDNYVFGGEESYGYLPVPFIRDKDSISSALALAQLAEETDLLKYLDALYLEHGLYLETLFNINLADKPIGFMQELLDKFQNPQDVLALNQHFAGRKVIDILDVRKNGARPQTPLAQELKANLPEAQVIQYWFEPEGRMTIRPSGTEPKVKIYLSLRYGKPFTADSLSAAKQELKNEMSQLLNKFLQTLGV